MPAEAPPRPRRPDPFAAPPWLLGAALVALAAWLGLLTAARLAHVAEDALAYALPAVELGPDAWRPQRPLGELPFRLDATASLLALGGPVLLAALGLGSWRDDAARTRFLVLFGSVDALFVFLYLHGLHGWRLTHAQTLLTWGARVLLLLAGPVALAWGAARARILALAGAALVALRYAGLWWLNGVYGPPAGLVLGYEGAMRMLVGLGLLDAAGLALLAAGVATAGRAALGRRPAAGAATAVPSGPAGGVAR